MAQVTHLALLMFSALDDAGVSGADGITATLVAGGSEDECWAAIAELIDEGPFKPGEWAEVVQRSPAAIETDQIPLPRPFKDDGHD